MFISLGWIRSDERTVCGSLPDLGIEAEMGMVEPGAKHGRGGYEEDHVEDK